MQENQNSGHRQKECLKDNDRANNPEDCYAATQEPVNYWAAGEESGVVPLLNMFRESSRLPTRN
jgi:hypothetical protein